MITGATAAVLVVAAVTTFWFATESGPFATVEPSQWALDMTEATGLRARGLDGTGVTVCIVDSGIETTHPDFQGLHLVAWRDFVNERTTPYDDEGHGTEMAGIIFSRGRIPGVAPAADLVAAKAIGASGAGADYQVAAAVRFCLDPNGDGNTQDAADVISLSLGGESHPYLGSSTETAVKDALSLGVIVVAAAGNDGQHDDGDVESPASVPQVIAVGAVNRQGDLAPWSSIGNNENRVDPNKKPEVVAPGVSIATTAPGNGYAYVSGTSPAAALVAGIVALLLDDHPDYRHNAARLVLFKEALMEGACGCTTVPATHDDHLGYGIVHGAATDALL